MEGALKKQIFMKVQPVFLSPQVNQLPGLIQFYTLHIIQNLFTSNDMIYEIDIEGNAVKMMGPYDSAETLSHLIEQLENGR